MNDPAFGKRIELSGSTTSETEKVILKVQGEDEELKAKYRYINALAKDKEELTKLKSSYAGAVMFFMWMWFGALILMTMSYFTYQMTLNREIPKEVIISVFTCTAIVVGLVGYILKGLFGGNQA